MPRQAPRTDARRRRIRGLGAALLVSLTLFGGLLVAAGLLEGPPATLPDSFGVAAPRIGDSWRYNVTLTGAWPLGADDTLRLGQPEPFAEFQWLPAEPQRGGDGLVRMANHVQGWVLAQTPVEDADGQTSFWGSRATEAWFRPSGPLVAWGGTGLRSHDPGGVGPLPASGDRSWWAVREYSFAAPPCLLWNPLQGAALDPREGLVLPGCILGDGFFAMEDQTLAATGIEEVNGLASLHYRNDGPWVREAWFAPGIPYPVRFHFTKPGLANATAEATIDLVAFEAGLLPLESKDGPGTEGAPDLVLSAPRPWGPDDAGVAAPFPASLAYAKARDDPAWRGLRDLLAASPDAYTANLHYMEASEQAIVRRVWFFDVTDGRQSVMFHVEQRVPRAATVLAGDAAMTYSVGGLSHEAGEAQPRPADAPRLVPTVASMVARWEAFRSNETSGGPVFWSYAYECGAACPAGQHLSVGLDELRYLGPGAAGPLGILGNGTRAASWLEFNGTETVRLVERSFQFPTGPRGASPLQPSQGFRDGESRPDPVRVLPSPTDPLVFGGVGVLAVVVGAAVAFWPKAHMAGFGLFSRVAASEVLAHPVRRRLADLVAVQPGIRFRALARAAGIGNGSAVHHLRKLVAAGDLQERRFGGYTCYFPAEATRADHAAAAVQADGARRLLDAIRADPGLTRREAAARAGLQPSTVSYHVQRLAEAGLVEARRDGHEVRLHPASKVL